jgi:arsenate reductase (glutaredoxin)
MVKIYHNPRCAKSREALAILRKKGLEPVVVEYLKTPPTIAELEHLAMLLHITPEAMLRKGEDLFKEKYRNLRLHPHEWIKVMAENPVLIERPIVVKGHRAIIARPPELLLDFL